MIVSIFTASASLLPMVEHSEIAAIAGKGLAGDRYATGQGFYSGVVEWDAHVTLMAEEPFLALAKEQNLLIQPEELRRNLVTRGIDLDQLIGREFIIGEQVRMRGRKAWPPCSHIVKHTGRFAIFQHLAKSTGIGADVITGGTLRVGDPIRLA